MPDLLVDTSVAVALLVADHDAHRRTVDALANQTLGIAGHAWFETYSVLTRLPPPLRRSPSDAGVLLRHGFPGDWYLGAEKEAALARELSALQIRGGSVYDALVGAAARGHGLPLATRDRRARPTYDKLGVDLRLLA